MKGLGVKAGRGQESNKAGDNTRSWEDNNKDRCKDWELDDG